MFPPDSLLMLELTLPSAAADFAAGALGELSPEGFEEQEIEGDPRALRYVVYAESDGAEALAEGVAALAVNLQRVHGDAVQLTRSFIPQQNWREAWKVHFTLQRVAPYVIRPSWIDYAPSEGEHMIHLDPGSAFGTGLHETTRLCLRSLAALDAQGRAPASVLDFGCGTGILGIGACRLWPCEVVAVDDDPLAIRACDENAERNGLTARISSAAQLPDGRRFDLVLANVSRPVLVAFAARLADTVAPVGRLILSGLLLEDRSAVIEAYEAQGLGLQSDTTEGEWLCLELAAEPAGPA